MFRKIFLGKSLTGPPGAFRFLSQTSTVNNANFVQQRVAYQEQLSDLRKKYRDEFKLIEERKLREKMAEKQKIIIQKAVRLRELRKQSVARQEVAKKARMEALVRYKNNLAKTHLLKSEKDVVQQHRYQMALNDLEEESKTWITMENLDEKITPELFANPATTGLLSRFSDNWRYMVTTEDLDRMLASGALDKNSENSLEDKFNYKAGFKFVKKSIVSDLLNQMIGTGEERAQYKELVDNYVKILGDMDAFEETQDGFNELSELLGDSHANGDNSHDDDDNEEEHDDDELNSALDADESLLDDDEEEEEPPAIGLSSRK